jgi:hypothetical protein
LNETGFLKNDQDAINDYDYERLYELFETMVSYQIKQVEVDIKKVIRGYCPDNLEKDYDLISNNPYFLMKETFTEISANGVFLDLCKKLSHKMSGWLRESTEETIRSGKKVNVFLNYQVTDKVKLIQRVMNRIIYGLNKDGGGDIHIRGGMEQADAGTAAETLTRFISVVKSTNNNANNQLSLKEKLANILFRANEMS